MMTPIHTWLAVAALVLTAAVCTAQQLPDSSGAIPQLRRNANGELEVVAPPPPGPATPEIAAPPTAAPPHPAAANPPPAISATKPTHPVTAAPATSAPAVAAPAIAKSEDIRLPEPLAVELPAGVSELTPSSSPLKDLLAAATDGERRVTSDLDHPVGIGAVKVTWSAWKGEPGIGAPVATKTALLFVMPTGVTPVAASGRQGATDGNNATKIARDGNGRLHMIWLDGGGKGRDGVFYRRAAVLADGSVQWETDPERVDDATSSAWNAYPSLAVTGGAVHVVWQGGNGTAYYRRLVHAGERWTWDEPRKSGVASTGRDFGPIIAAMDDDLVEIVTPGGSFALSKDGGKTWHAEPIPLPPGQTMKTVTFALDRFGNSHVAFAGVVRGPNNASTKRASHGYWELRYIRRASDGTWSDAENVLADRREWADPGNDDDILADWPRIAVDGADNLHLTWHGTEATHIYANDHAYYRRRPVAGPGLWATAWDDPQSLMPLDAEKGAKFSFAPSLSLDRDVAMPLVFYEVYDGDQSVGFDSAARVVRSGKLEGPPIPVTQWIRASLDQNRAEAGLSARFPAAAPSLRRTPDGHLWLDVLETLIPTGSKDMLKLVAYQRLDVTSAVLGEAVGAPRPRQVAAAIPAAAPSKAAVWTPDHVVIVIEENLSSRHLNPNLPYLAELAHNNAYFTNAHGIDHPSQPNYLALFSGSTQGTGSEAKRNPDGSNPFVQGHGDVGTDSPLHSTPLSTPNLGAALRAAGLSFAGYSEDLPSIGFTGESNTGPPGSGIDYQRKHNPWVNWQAADDSAIGKNQLPSTTNLPMSAFPTDDAGFAKLPTVAIVVPNQINDAHQSVAAPPGTDYAHAMDNWLKQHIEPYRKWAATHNSLLIVTWDEDEDDGTLISDANGRAVAKKYINLIPTIMAGQGVVSGSYGEYIDHYSVLRTIEDFYGLAPMADGDRKARGIADMFRNPGPAQ